MRSLLYLVFNCFIAMCGYTIHGSVFWCIIDWIFSPIVLIYWLVTHQLTSAVIKATFSWFFN
jgi:hypothetical protein